MLEILSDRCGAAYQVVGALADYADLYDPAVVKAIDLLAWALRRCSFSPFNPKKIQEKNLAELQRRQSAGKRWAVSRKKTAEEVTVVGRIRPQSWRHTVSMVTRVDFRSRKPNRANRRWREVQARYPSERKPRIDEGAADRLGVFLPHAAGAQRIVPGGLHLLLHVVDDLFSVGAIE